MKKTFTVKTAAAIGLSLALAAAGAVGVSASQVVDELGEERVISAPSGFSVDAFQNNGFRGGPMGNQGGFQGGPTGGQGGFQGGGQNGQFPGGMNRGEEDGERPELPELEFDEDGKPVLPEGAELPARPEGGMGPMGGGQRPELPEGAESPELDGQERPGAQEPQFDADGKPVLPEDFDGELDENGAPVRPEGDMGGFGPQGGMPGGDMGGFGQQGGMPGGDMGGFGPQGGMPGGRG
ncbi:MAG: hypothetical protein IJ705_01375 [Oscillospiraceae bacterium]|nr:hypothetical protein [Oscillospiraceae bacterium]